MKASDPKPILKLHSFAKLSRANGPGKRAVVWFQGCSLACVGCFNPETHTSQGDLWLVDRLVETLQADNASLDGITVSGGEPLEQPDALRELIQNWKAYGQGTVIVLTGYTWQEIQGDPQRRDAVQLADVVVSGRYNASQHLGSGLRGSRNKEYHFLTDDYSEEDFRELPEIEILIDESGTIIWTGMEPPQFP